MSSERLLEIKKKISQAKTRQAEITGQMAGVKEQMETKFEISTLSAAEKKLSKIDKSLDRMETEFTEGMKGLEESYDWDEMVDIDGEGRVDSRGRNYD